MNNWIASPGASLSGSLRVPGDKSISHRAVMLGALAAGVTRISGFLEGEDTRATARVFSQLGVRIEAPSEGERIVHGVGLRGLRGSDRPLDCGNAGTGTRLLAGVLAGQAFDSTLIGDASLSRRPMRRVIDPLSSMGARIDSEPGGLPPLRIHGGSRLTGVAIDTPVASAQVKSALLLAGLYADGETEVREPHPTRDYTERMLSAFATFGCVQGLTSPPPACGSRRNMINPVHGFHEGDRVRAPRRPSFPAGTVVKLMQMGYLLVRGDGDVLETAHHADLVKLSASESRP